MDKCKACDGTEREVVKCTVCGKDTLKHQGGAPQRCNECHQQEVNKETEKRHGRVVLEFTEGWYGEPNEIRLAPASDEKPERYVIQGWNEGGYNCTVLGLELALKEIAANKELSDWLPTVGIELRLGSEMAAKDMALITVASELEQFREKLTDMHRRAQKAESVVANYKVAYHELENKNAALAAERDALLEAIGKATWKDGAVPTNLATALEDLQELSSRARRSS